MRVCAYIVGLKAERYKTKTTPANNQPANLITLMASTVVKFSRRELYARVPAIPRRRQSAEIIYWPTENLDP